MLLSHLNSSCLHPQRFFFGNSTQKIWGKKFKGKKKKKEERKKKRGKEGKRERKKEGKKKRKRKEEEKKRMRKRKGRGKKKKEGKKRVEIGEETLMKFAVVPLGKFLKINIYLKLEVRVFRRGEGGSFVDGKNW